MYLGPSDLESTMTTMLIPQLVSVHRHSSTNDSGADTLDIYSSSSASETELTGHRWGMPKGKKM